MLIYFDLCALQRPHDDQSQERVRAEAAAVERLLEHCQTGAADLVSSDALMHECSRNPDSLSRADVQATLATAARHLSASKAVGQRANALMAAGLQPLDALHLASAESAGADRLCTCDDQLLRRGRSLAVPPLIVVSPVELVTELGI